MVSCYAILVLCYLARSIISSGGILLLVIKYYHPGQITKNDMVNSWNSVAMKLKTSFILPKIHLL